MKNRYLAALLALATLLCAPVAAQVTPQLGIASSGSCRDLSVRDATLPGLVPFLCVDTSTHTTKIKTDGGSMTGDLSFGGTKRVIDLASPTNSGDAVTKNYVDTLFLPLTGGTMTGDIYLGGTRRVVGSASPINTGDLTTKFYVDSNFQPLDTDLTSIAALSTTSFGRSLLTGADAAATRTTLGLGTAATANTGTSGATIPRNDTSNTFSANQVIAHPTASSILAIQTIDGQEASLRFRTGGSERWRFAKNNASETGANAGSNFLITRFDDAGASLGTALAITRSSGDIAVGGLIRPTADNSFALGGVSNRWSNIYGATITTANAAITGGSITGITDLAVADGGTGASTAAAARTNLGITPDPQEFTPTNGGTITVANSTAMAIEVFLEHASSVTGQTINLPTPFDGQRVTFYFREAMSSITWAAPTGTILGTFTGTTANARAGWVYRASTGRWVRIA